MEAHIGNCRIFSEGGAFIQREALGDLHLGLSFAFSIASRSLEVSNNGFGTCEFLRLVIS